MHNLKEIKLKAILTSILIVQQYSSIFSVLEKHFKILTEPMLSTQLLKLTREQKELLIMLQTKLLRFSQVTKRRDIMFMAVTIRLR